MADRYWVGGSGSWNSTAKWSTTSGGSSGASVPTSADNAIFDANSGTAHFTVTVTLNATCADLTITPEPIAGVTQFAVDNGFVITGTFSTSGTAGNQRVWFRSSTYGLMRDIQIATIGTVTDVDFRDIRVTGAGGTLSGTRIGDLRGNSGITFSTPKTAYWNLAAGGTWVDNAWAATSGGGVNTDNFPLAQDTAVIENTGLNSAANIFLITSIPYLGSMDMSSRTVAFTLVMAPIAVYGNWTNGSGVTFSGGNIITFSGRNTQTITSAGKTLSFPVTVDTYGGTVELADALNIGGQTFIVTNGTFDTKNYNVTAGNFISNNSNVRTINLGSSTVTISGDVTFTTSTNLTFNSGTSSITFTSSAVTFNAGAQTFYNVSFSSTNSSTYTINQSNTFNSLSITAPAAAGLRQVSFAGDQTITGTLTVAGASPVRRIFVRSNTIGTTRTLTVNSLSATDCDFRDITITGAAAGSTPTRAGDCGGNTGITFPAPKTVYWNLAGAQNWSSTGWAASSAGTPDINNFPLAQDTAVFDNAGSVTGTITINDVWNIGTFDASARTSAMTFTANSSQFVYGNWLFGTGVTQSTAGTITFAGRGTQTITSNGNTFNCSVEINSATGTVQLADAFTSSLDLVLLSGEFNAVSYAVTARGFASSVTVTRTLKMGSAIWTLTGSNAAYNVWSLNSTSGLNFYKGSADIVFSNTSTSARAFDGGNLSYNKLTIGGATGTSTLTITGNNQFTELASTKTVAHTIALGGTTQTFGAWTVTGTAGNVVTVTGTGTNHVIAGARVSGVDYLAMGTIGFAATSPGEFYAGVNSTGSNATIIKTAAPAAVTRYWVGGTGTWDATTTTNWSATSGGLGGASVPTSADAVVFDSMSNATAYTVTCTATQLRCGSLTMAGPLVGNVTWAGSAPLAIHDNVNLAATGITRSYTGNITLTSSSTGRTLTTNGVTLASAITVNGVGCGWSLSSALNIGTATLTVTNGSIDFATYNFTVGSFDSSNNNARAISFGSGTTTTSASIDFGLTDSTAADLTVTAGTAQINFSGPSPAIQGNGKTFYNVAFTNTASSTVTISGANTYNNLSFTNVIAAGLKPVSILNNQTINGTLTLSAGTNATMRTFLQSNTIGTARTLTCAAVSATDADFRDIIIAGAAAPVSGTRLGDCKGNSGITFDAAKTVYWNLAGNNNWSATAWATSAGGTPDVNNFPLAQDTAVFTSTSPSTGESTNINAAWNIGTIDMSARTTNTMTLATATQNLTIYGNWINGSGVTVTTSSGSLRFSGRNTQEITSAGKTLQPFIVVNSLGGTVRLNDAASLLFDLTLTQGTIDFNGYNLTARSFNSNNTNIRVINIGSGMLTFNLGSTDWGVLSTNLTVTGTGTISLTSASPKTFAGGGVSYSGITLNQGGAGTLTITGNNTFANITNTYKATGATTIALGTTTQRVGAFGASGEAGRVLTVTGSSATNPATLVFTGSGQATTPTTDYLTITGVRAYSLDTTWYAGSNSTNNGSLGWYFEAAGGGGAITVFITEASTAADSLSSLATFNIGVSETITASEAQAAGLLFLGTLAESTTAADVAAAFQAYTGAIAEATTATDLIAALLTLNAAISELTVAADSQSSLASFGVGISETITASEAQASGLICLGTLSETATAADVAAAFQAYLGAVAEATTATDLIAASLTLNAAISELTTGLEQIATTLSSSASVSELISAADSLNGGLLFLSNISEATTAQEVAAAGLIFNRAIAEATTAAEVLVAIAAFNAAVPELVSGGDVAQALLTVGGSVNEALAALDASAALLTMSPEIAETASAQEVAANVYTANSSIAEAAQSVDSLAVAPSTFGAVALAVAQAIESLSPAGSIYNAALPIESAGITDFLVGSYLWNPIDDTQTANWQNVSNGQNPGWTQISDAQSPGWFVIPTARD